MTKRAVKVLALFAVCLSAAAVCAADKTPPLSARAVLDRISARQKEVFSLRADFIQTKFFAEMEEETVFSGSLLYKSPDRVKWTYLEPDESVLVMKGDTATLFVPELEQVETYTISENPKLEFFRSYFSRGFEAFGEFECRLAKCEPLEDGSMYYEVTLKPRRESELYAGVEFSVSSKDWTPTRIKVVEKNGDYSVTELRAVKTGVAAGDGDFAVVVPKNAGQKKAPAPEEKKNGGKKKIAK